MDYPAYYGHPFPHTEKNKKNLSEKSGEAADSLQHLVSAKMAITRALFFWLALLVLATSGVRGAGLGGGVERVVMGSAVVQRLEREAQRDEMSADREADRARRLEDELGETATTKKFANLESETNKDKAVGAEREISDDMGAAKQFQQLERQINTDEAGKKADDDDQHPLIAQEPRVANADDIPGERAVESVLQDGEKVLNMVEGAETTKGPRTQRDGGRGDTNMPGGRDLIAEAEVEGGCLGECQGPCLATCHSSPLAKKEDFQKCELKCQKICLTKCQNIQSHNTAHSRQAPTRTERMKKRLQAKEGTTDTAEQKPKMKWGWQKQMEADAAAGKQMGPPPIMSRPMDEKCKSECLGKCQGRCTKKSTTPEKCPRECTTQCEDDCYIVEVGAPPPLDQVFLGNGNLHQV